MARAHRNVVGQAHAGHARDGSDIVGDTLLHAGDSNRSGGDAARNGNVEGLQFFRAYEAGIYVGSAWKVRIIRPDLISRTKARATCTTTSVLRARWRWRLSLAPRPAVRNAATPLPA
jgi:hypothetical protein